MYIYLLFVFLCSVVLVSVVGCCFVPLIATTFEYYFYLIILLILYIFISLLSWTIISIILSGNNVISDLVVTLVMYFYYVILISLLVYDTILLWGQIWFSSKVNIIKYHFFCCFILLYQVAIISD